MDISMLSAINTSLAAIKDIGGTLVSIRDETKLATIRAELLSRVIDVQLAMSAIMEERDTLRMALIEAKKEIAETNKSALELDKYEQFEVTTGVWAYRAKDGHALAKKSPPYCACCFKEHKLSILQRRIHGYQGFLQCNRCNLEIEDGTFETPSL